MDALRRVAREDVNARLSRVVVVGVCLFTCIVAIGSCVYCTYILYLIRNIHTDWTSHYDGFNTQGQDSVIKSATDDRHLKNNLIVEYTESDDVLSRSIRAARETRHKKCKCPKTVAAQYEQVIRPDYFDRTFPPYDDRQSIYNENIQGLIHADGDFQSKDYPLKIFQLASGWKEKSSPFKPLKSDGKFIAKKSGSYLINLQVVFFDKMSIQEIKIVHRRKDVVQTEYSCVRGLAGQAIEPVKNTCSVNSLFLLKKNDFIRVEVVDVNQRLNLFTVNTYIGVVLLR